MVCCWISIITTSGFPVAQFSSDALPVPFSVQGVLSALQSNASVCQAKIRLIETELADIAYHSGSEIMLICTMGKPFQKLATSMLSNVQSCLRLLDCYQNEHASRQLMQDIKVVNPIFSKLLQDSHNWLQWIGLPIYRIHKPNSFLEDLISIARCFSEMDCAAIVLPDGSIIRSSAGWLNLTPSDIWAIVLLGFTTDADPYYEYSIKIAVRGTEMEKKLIIIKFPNYFITIVTSPDSTKSKDVVAALNQFKESESALEPIESGFGIKGYLLLNSSSASIWLAEGEQYSDLSQILLEDYCLFLDSKFSVTNVDDDIMHVGQYTIAKVTTSDSRQKPDSESLFLQDWTVYWYNDDDLTCIVCFSNEVPPSCFEYVAKSLLEYLKPFYLAILE